MSDKINDTIEAIKKTVAIGAKKAVEKSSELYDYTKTTLAISALQSDIDKEYLEIGKLVYMSNKGIEVESGDIEVHCANIDSYLAEIEIYSSKLAKLKNREVCPYCNAQIMTDSTFCANCGEKINH